ncbi:MAG: glycosyltransferase [Candidatus Rokubacteria bacterium]|nr:glycosyltransferase [Candidatus Rokubacteria bacterium]
MIRVMHVLSSIKDVKHFTGLAYAHDRRLVDMQVCTIDGPGVLQASLAPLGVRGHALECGRRALYPRAVARLARLLRRERIDVVHTHLFDPTLVGMTAAVLARTPGRVMTRHHADLHFFLGKPWHVRLDRWSALTAHRVIAVSGQARQVLVEMEGVPADRVEVVIPGSFFTPGMRAPAEAVATVRAELGLEGRTVLGVVARLHPIKGQRDLFQALPALLEAHPNLAVLLVGEGWLKEALEDLAKELAITDHVVFAGYRSDMYALYGAMDILVHPSYEDSVATPVMEAMAMGVPVVCTPKGVALDLVRDGETGLLVPPGDPARLAAALRRLLDDPALRAAIGARGPAMVGDRFSFATQARGYERCYQQVLERRRVVPRW